MLNDDSSRRDFLKKFALLSAGSLMLSATTLACYGPGPVSNGPTIPCTVSGMFFVDVQSHRAMLSGDQNVPVHTQFLIEFSKTMNKSAATTVVFTDPNTNAVAYTTSWGNDYALSVTPVSDLSADHEYTLRVTAAVSADGAVLEITNTATAVFKTAIA
jgi:hypothetical protein